VWFADGRYLLWSDIPNNRIMKWEEETGAVSVFRQPSNFGNGNTRDRQGRLVTCEHGRRFTRTEYDGTITVLAESFEGRRLNSPNDVVVKSDGAIWFTDPPFGILGNYEGYKAEPELPQNVYRIDPASGALSVVATRARPQRPGVLARREDPLSGRIARATPTRALLAYDVVDGGTKLANPRPFIDAGEGGTPDGFRVRCRRQSVVRLGHGPP